MTTTKDKMLKKTKKTEPKLKGDYDRCVLMMQRPIKVS